MNILRHREFLNCLRYFNIYLLFTHVDNVHLCCSSSTDVSVLTHGKGTCQVLLHVSAAWSWHHHDSDQCVAPFIIAFVSTVLFPLHHVADIMSWLLQFLMHASVQSSSVCLCLCLFGDLSWLSIISHPAVVSTVCLHESKVYFCPVVIFSDPVHYSVVSVLRNHGF
jgi:hypothetical protein